MSLQEHIAEWLPIRLPEFDISPRIIARSTNSVAGVAANAVQALATNIPLPILGPNDGLWFELVTGSFGASVGTATTSTIDAPIRDAATNNIMRLFQPTVTTLNLTVNGANSFQFFPVLPLVLFTDLDTLSRIRGLGALNQPLNLQVLFNFTNGATGGQAFNIELEVVVRQVRGIQ